MRIQGQHSKSGLDLESRVKMHNWPWLLVVQNLHIVYYSIRQVYFTNFKAKISKSSLNSFASALFYIWPCRNTKSRSIHKLHNPDSIQVLMQHTKFKAIGQFVQEKTVFKIVYYGHDSHIDHMAWLVWPLLVPTTPRNSVKFGNNLPSGFWVDVLNRQNMRVLGQRSNND